MKPVGAGAFIGALLGAIIAILAHFMSHTLPSTYFIDVDTDGHQVNQTLGSPLIHPSWWPVLPISIAAGVLAGAVLVLATTRAGYSLGRRPHAARATATQEV